MPDGKCRSCGNDVVWVKTVKGKRMPLDPEPVDDGNVWVMRVDNGTPVIGVALNSDGVPALVTQRYVAHFVTCPQADEWRKKR